MHRVLSLAYDREGGFGTSRHSSTQVHMHLSASLTRVHASRVFGLGAHAPGCELTRVHASRVFGLGAHAPGFELTRHSA